MLTAEVGEQMVAGPQTEPISVGVIIPAFNRQSGVLNAVASVAAQSLRPRRVVIVDDGSQPPLQLPRDVLDGLDVQIIRHSENRGPAAARQTGLKALATSHVAFLDSDDTWVTSKLEKQISYLSKLAHPNGTIVVCGWSPVNADGEIAPPKIPRPSNDLEDFCSGCWFSPGSTAIAPRNLLLDVGGFDERLRRLEDLDIFIRLACADAELAVAPFVGAHIRKGRNARRCDVDPAAAYLRQKFLGAGSPLTTKTQRRNLDSWLAIEEAAAALNDGAYTRFTERMVRSFALNPRRRLHLRDWWPTD